MKNTRSIVTAALSIMLLLSTSASNGITLNSFVTASKGAFTFLVSKLPEVKQQAIETIKTHPYISVAAAIAAPVVVAIGFHLYKGVKNALSKPVEQTIAPVKNGGQPNVQTAASIAQTQVVESNTSANGNQAEKNQESELKSLTHVEQPTPQPIILVEQQPVENNDQPNVQTAVLIAQMVEPNTIANGNQSEKNQEPELKSLAHVEEPTPQPIIPVEQQPVENNDQPNVQTTVSIAQMVEPNTIANGNQAEKNQEPELKSLTHVEQPIPQMIILVEQQPVENNSQPNVQAVLSMVQNPDSAIEPKVLLQPVRSDKASVKTRQQLAKEAAKIVTAKKAKKHKAALKQKTETKEDSNKSLIIDIKNQAEKILNTVETIAQKKKKNSTLNETQTDELGKLLRTFLELLKKLPEPGPKPGPEEFTESDYIRTVGKNFLDTVIGWANNKKDLPTVREAFARIMAKIIIQ